MAFIIFFFIPLLYLIISLVFAFKKRGTATGKAAAASLVTYLITFALGTVLIFSSRGSTSAVGFLFLPYYSLIPAALASAYVIIKQNITKKIILVCIVGFWGFVGYQIIGVRAVNTSRDKLQEERMLQINTNRQWLKNLSSKDLEDIYKNSSYPEYYFSDLARQANTPSDILIELYEVHRQKNSGIEIGLASNPSLPKELVNKLMQSTNPLVQLTSH